MINPRDIEGTEPFMIVHQDMTVNRRNRISDVQVMACPRCAARSMLYRTPFGLIDSCGFESYSLECKACGAPLVGIIDPADDILLVSVES